jgi:hypothetical protein
MRANSPAIRRRDAALPWGFWCAVHSLCRRPLAGAAIEILFDAAALTALDPLAGGARDALATGRDDARPLVPDLLVFATAPHRRPSPPQLHPVTALPSKPVPLLPEPRLLLAGRCLPALGRREGEIRHFGPVSRRDSRPPREPRDPPIDDPASQNSTAPPSNF